MLVLKMRNSGLVFTHFSHILIDEASRETYSSENLDGFERLKKVSDCIEK